MLIAIREPMTMQANASSRVPMYVGVRLLRIIPSDDYLKPYQDS